MKEWLITPDRFLSKNELGKLLQRADELWTIGTAKKQKQAIREWVGIRVAILSGLRASEITNLKVSECYVGYGKSEVLVRNGKGGKSRIVKIGADLKKDLRWYLKWKSEQGENDNSEYLLRSQRGNKLTANGIWRRWKAYCPNHRLHDSRHTYATMLYESSRDIRLVQKQLGHSRITTSSVYADVCDEQAREGIDAMEKAVNHAMKLPKDCELAKNLPDKPGRIAGKIAS